MSVLGAVALAVYVVCALCSIPIIARHIADEDWQPSTRVAVAIGACYAWPFFAALGLVVWVSERLAPLIFRGRNDA